MEQLLIANIIFTTILAIAIFSIDSGNTKKTVEMYTYINEIEKKQAIDHNLIWQMWPIVIELADKYNNALVVGVSDKDAFDEMKRRAYEQE